MDRFCFCRKTRVTVQTRTSGISDERSLEAGRRIRGSSGKPFRRSEGSRSRARSVRVPRRAWSRGSHGPRDEGVSSRAVSACTSEGAGRWPRRRASRRRTASLARASLAWTRGAGGHGAHGVIAAGGEIVAGALDCDPPVRARSEGFGGSPVSPARAGRDFLPAPAATRGGRAAGLTTRRAGGTRSRRRRARRRGRCRCGGHRGRSRRAGRSRGPASPARGGARAASRPRRGGA